MSNNLTAASPEYRSARMQLLLKKALVAREISNMEERAGLTNGIKVHRPYYSDVKVNTYTKGTAVTAQDVTITDEYLTIDQTKEATIYVDQVDKIQNKYDVANRLIDRIGYALKKDIDGAFLARVVDATYQIDDSDFGGTANNGIATSVSNVFKLFTTVEAKANTANIEDTKPWYFVVTPYLKALMQQTNLANGFNQADAALQGTLKGMGYMGTRGNMNVFVSNNVKHVQKFTTSDILVAGQTVSIAGVTFTAAADNSAAAAGEFSIQASEDNCMATLVTAINGSGTPGADTYIEVSTANRAILKNAGVVASYAAHVLTVTTQGSVALAETSTVGAWGTPIAHCWFGQYGATDLVIQSDVSVQQNKEPLLTGYNYLCWTLYGIKTFTEGANRAIRVLINA